jgi:hypothetical protein
MSKSSRSSALRSNSSGTASCSHVSLARARAAHTLVCTPPLSHLLLGDFGGETHAAHGAARGWRSEMLISINQNVGDNSACRSDGGSSSTRTTSITSSNSNNSSTCCAARGRIRFSCGTGSGARLWSSCRGASQCETHKRASERTRWLWCEHSERRRCHRAEQKASCK